MWRRVTRPKSRASRVDLPLLHFLYNDEKDENAKTNLVVLL
jgi:hypothetical protein